MLFSEWVKGQDGTRAEVAERIGLSRDALQKIMRGQTFPRLGTRQSIEAESKGRVTTDDLVSAYNEFHTAKR